MILGNQVTELFWKILVKLDLTSIKRFAYKLFVHNFHVHMTSDLRIESFKFVVIVVKLIPASQDKAVVHIHFVPHCYCKNWPQFTKSSEL